MHYLTIHTASNEAPLCKSVVIAFFFSSFPPLLFHQCLIFIIICTKNKFTWENIFKSNSKISFSPYVMLNFVAQVTMQNTCAEIFFKCTCFKTQRDFLSFPFQSVVIWKEPLWQRYCILKMGNPFSVIMVISLLENL